MAVVFKSELQEVGSLCCMEAGGGRIPFQAWALHEADLTSVERRAVQAVFRLHAAEAAEDLGDGRVLVPAQAVAALTSLEVQRLGLPEPAPCTVLLEHRGLLTDRDFEFRYELVDGDGRPVVGWLRRGAFLEYGGRAWTLLDPLYSVIDAIDRFNSNPPDGVDQRFLDWSRIRALLPESAQVDPYLGGTQAVLASSFTLDVHADPSGGVTFEPVLVRRPPPSRQAPGEPGPESQAPADSVDARPVLPPGVMDDLGRQFRKFGNAKSRYALPGGWFVAVDSVLQGALQVVREMQSASPAERRRFAANPYPVLRERLGGAAGTGSSGDRPRRETGTGSTSDDAIEELLGAVFVEPADYGDRVTAAGAWNPKVLPFLQASGQSWLPDEPAGLLVDSVAVQIAPGDLAGVRERLVEAIEQGVRSIEHNGCEIPATQEALDAVDALGQGMESAAAPAGDDAEPELNGRQVLLLQEKDNLLDLGYVLPAWKRRGGQAGMPTGLEARLKPHQVAGVSWLQKHWLEGSPGALLADDMGLGKTLQVLAFLRWMRDQVRDAKAAPLPILVVAPTGLLANWADEHEMHLAAPGLGTPLRAHGSGLRGLRRAESAGVKESASGAPVLDVSELQRADWVLTTYETLRDYAHSFARVRWSAAVIDEAQKIKNPAALVTEQCKAVLSNAAFVIAMTGTPVENRLADLWSISDACQPGVLKDLRSFVGEYDLPAAVSRESVQRLQSMIMETSPAPEAPPQLMLRRMKWQELRGLPRKSIAEIRCDMPDVQASAYSDVVRRARQQAVSKGGMLETLQALRRVSLHPRLDEQVEPDDVYINGSARLKQTMQILDGIRDSRERALIFLESLDFQPILQGLIQRRYQLDHRPMVINGEVGGEQRRRIVRAFQEGEGFDCLILSPKAGGVGITLTAANHVIHLSRWWNPAVEDQCTDRVYRIGQHRPVYVHVPLAIHPVYGQSSFDEQLNALLTRKRELSRDVLGLDPSGTGEADFTALFNETVEGGER